MNLPILKSLTTKSLLPVGAALLTAVIFVCDTLTNLDVAAAVFYTAVVLMSVRFCQRRGVILVAAGCIGLTVLSSTLTIPNGSLEAGLINTAISVAAILTTTFLALRIESAMAAVYETRAQLAHIGRITILGELTASIAHEVNQPLAATVTNGNACLRWLAAAPPNLVEARHAVENIVKDANRASGVIARLRALTQRRPTEMVCFSMNELIHDTLALADREIKSNRISVQARLAVDLPQIRGDPVQLQQVLLNLILNAIDAINLTSAGARELVVESRNGKSQSIVVSVFDTGVGLAKDRFEELFDAFYTTKRDGTGMGLAISRSIVDLHGGRIWAEKNSPRGAVFRFQLPVNSGDSARALQ